MYNYLGDIIDKLGEPLWWDSEAAIPRYCKFHPDKLNNVYAKEAVLLLTECQNCGHRFKISEDFDMMDEIGGRKPLSKQIKEGHMMGYTDPPNTHCCDVGPTMTSNVVEIF